LRITEAGVQKESTEIHGLNFIELRRDVWLIFCLCTETDDCVFVGPRWDSQPVHSVDSSGVHTQADTPESRHLSPGLTVISQPYLL